VKLFWFHHAGGSASSFRGFRELFPSHWQLRFLEHPGRGRSFVSRPIDDMPSLLAHLTATIAPELATPFAFFGHSMGAIVAAELARHLVAHGYPAPAWIGVSGSPAPGARPPAEVPTHLLDDAELSQHLRELGGTPDEVFACAELLTMVLRTLRADYKLIETWAPRSSPAPLPIPMAAYGGRDDEGVPRRALEAWRSEVTAPPAVRMFPGGHFYLMERPAEVARAIVADLTQTLEGNPGARPHDHRC
jgi:surfactin synthase thioesterase subunit